MSLLEPPQELLNLLRESLPDSLSSTTGDADADGFEDVLAYVAFLAAGLCEAQDFTPATWIDVLKPYLDNVTKEECVDKFRESAEKVTLAFDDDDSYGDEDEDGQEEVCNIRFK